MSIVATDKFGRQISSTDNGDGTTNYSTTTGISIVLNSDESINDVISIFNGMSPSLGSYPLEIQRKLTAFNSAVLDYTHAYYDAETQLRFFIIYYLSSTGGPLGAASKPNRAAYILPLLTWAQSVIEYSATFVSTVSAMTDATAIKNYNWDFSQIGAVPSVTLLGAIAISN